MSNNINTKISITEVAIATAVDIAVDIVVAVVMVIEMAIGILVPAAY